MPVAYWIYGGYNKVKVNVALMRLTAGWPINWALERPVQNPIVWRHEVDKTSLFRGVSWMPVQQLWRASLKDPNTDRRSPRVIAYTDDECLAAAIYNIGARYLFGGSARLNLM